MTKRRNAREVGALFWILHHLQDVKSVKDMSEIDLSSKAGLDAFVHKYGCDKKKLSDTGRRIEDGVAPNIEQTPYIPLPHVHPDPTGHQEIRLLPAVFPNWHQTDLTVPLDDDEHGEDARDVSIVRSSTIPQRAVDLMIMVGLRLNLGRCQIDQCYPTDLARQPEPSAVLRTILSRPWGSLEDEAKESLSNILVATLTEYDDVKFPPSNGSSRGNTFGFRDVFEACAIGFPQLCWTSIAAFVCGESIENFQPNAVFRRFATIPLSQKQLEVSRTLQVFLWDLGCPDDLRLPAFVPVGQEAVSCPNGKHAHQCDGRHSFPSFCYDRPPPTLVIEFDVEYNVRREVAINREVFKKVSARFRTREGTEVVEYVPYGAVYSVSATTYAAVWLVERGDVVRLECTRTGDNKVESVSGWCEHPYKDCLLMMVFFRRDDSPQGVLANDQRRDEAIHEGSFGRSV